MSQVDGIPPFSCSRVLSIIGLHLNIWQWAILVTHHALRCLSGIRLKDCASSRGLIMIWLAYFQEQSIPVQICYFTYCRSFARQWQSIKNIWKMFYVKTKVRAIFNLHKNLISIHNCKYKLNLSFTFAQLVIFSHTNSWCYRFPCAVSWSHSLVEGQIMLNFNGTHTNFNVLDCHHS